ncbi:SRPBCC family protein [Solicola sp. PLA-1-18]|uniref:SRPBCC family protein n=1 Tax=Solicola sp. PLA-1-18 TaxID=3380532 RepID=UPI003B76BA38
MDLSHTFTVPASVEETWAAFNDLEGIAPCFPGAVLTGVDGDEFTGTVKVKLGPIALQYGGTGKFLERDEANRRAVIEAKGKDKRGNGTAGATVVAQLSADGEGTKVEVTTDLAVTGKPAQFGRGVMQDVSDKLLGRFVDCIATKLGPDAEPEPEPAPAASAAAPDSGAPTPGDGPAATAPPTGPQGGGQRRATPPPREAEEIDLGATVLPVLLKRYGVPAGIGLVVLLVLVRLVRR